MESINCGRLLLPGPHTTLPPLSLAHLPQTKQLVARNIATQLFQKSHFDICLVRDLIDLTGASKDSEAMRLLRPLHCVHWSDMDQALRDSVPLLVREALETNTWAKASTDLVLSALDPTP